MSICLRTVVLPAQRNQDKTVTGMGYIVLVYIIKCNIIANMIYCKCNTAAIENEKIYCTIECVCIYYLLVVAIVPCFG